MPRKIHIAASVAIHAVIIIVLFLNLGPGHSDDPSTPQLLLETELVKPQSDTSVNSTNELANKENENGEYKTDVQVDYAGAPSQPQQPTEQPGPEESNPDDFSSFVSDSLLAQQEHVATAEQSVEYDHLWPLADILQVEGLQVPSFSITDLSIDQMEEIAKNGQGLFVVICGSDVFRTVGCLKNPSNLILINNEDLIRFSHRALNVPIGSSNQIRSKLQFEFGVSAEIATAVKIRLLLANSIDRMILARQRGAASSRGLDLKQVLQTTGRFCFLNGRITDFQISSLLLQDGRVLPAEDDSVKSMVGRLTSVLKGGQDNEG